MDRPGQPISLFWRWAQQPGWPITGRYTGCSHRLRHEQMVWARPIKDLLGISVLFSLGLLAMGWCTLRVASGQLCYQMRQSAWDACWQETNGEERRTENGDTRNPDIICSLDPTLPEAGTLRTYYLNKSANPSLLFFFFSYATLEWVYVTWRTILSDVEWSWPKPSNGLITLTSVAPSGVYFYIYNLI